MLNILIAKDKTSRSNISNLFDWSPYKVDKLIISEDISKLPFKNIDDIDFIITDTYTLSNDGFKLLDQVTEKRLNNKLVLLGPEKNIEKLTYIIYNGVKCYEPDLKNAEKTLQGLFDKRIAEKEHEKMILSQLHDGTIVKKVKQALDKGDSRFLQKIISYGGKIIPVSLFHVKEYYSLIMETVFEFAEEKGVRRIDKKEILAELIEFSNFESLKECAIKRINRIIHLVEVNKNNQNKLVVEHIKGYIDKNYMEQDTNAGNIAEQFGVSGSYIGMLFREQQKTTITKYITQLRINKAAELLTETKLQIQTISKKVGYSDQNYFARIFKKQTGLSPGEYRTKYSH